MYHVLAHIFLNLIFRKTFLACFNESGILLGHPAHSDMVLDMYLSITQKLLYISYMRASYMKSFHPLLGLKYPLC